MANQSFGGMYPEPKKRKWYNVGQVEAGQKANQPMKGTYASQPSAPADKVASKPLIPKQDGSLGEGAPKMVPHKTGKFDGLGGIPHRMAKPVANAHGFGHPVTQRMGAMRVSGHPSAHHIGKVKIPK